MKRREFSHLVCGAFGLATLVGGTGNAVAQVNQVDSKEYVRLAQAVPSNAPPGKIEVIEFFLYGAPTSFAFQRMIDTWKGRLPASVVFRRLPLVLRPYQESQAMFFYALEAMGMADALHSRIFSSIHVANLEMVTLKQFDKFVQENGVDIAKFELHFNSLSVKVKVKQGIQLANEYRVNGLPAIGVQGRYYTDLKLAGSNERLLQGSNYLIQIPRSS